MAAGNFILFGKNKGDINPNALVGANLRLGIVTSAYVPNVTATGHSLWSEVSANEISGGGYAAATLTGAASATAGNDGFKLSSGNAAWTATGTAIPAHRYYVLYYFGTLWGKVNPLIGYFVGDATPADIPATTVGNSLTANCPATGWFDAV
jgi:hypothetical protein